MQVKTVGYAYPTSPFAKLTGYEKEGCYFVAVHREHAVVKGSNIVFATDVKEDALSFAKDIPVEYDYFSLKD